MKRWLWVLVLAAFVPGDAIAARWEIPQVIVRDHLSDDMRADVMSVVDDFNANLPTGAPELVYEAMPEQPCEALEQEAGVIQVCRSTLVPDVNAAWQPRTINEDAFVSGQIAIRWNYWMPSYRPTVCHEMMHAITDVPDDPSEPHRDESCVQGTLNHLGPWDIAYATDVYAAPPADVTPAPIVAPTPIVTPTPDPSDRPRHAKRPKHRKRHH
jgi:hypothetical protein